jgi:hypothetical protein
MGFLKSGTATAQTNTIAGVDTVNSNNFTLTAVEDLGGGLKATAVIQNRMGALNNDLNSGDMYVTVAGGFGSVRAGKWTFNSHSGYNAFASRTISSVGGTAQAFAANNVVQYSTPEISGFTVTAGLERDGSTLGAGKDGSGLKAVYAKGPLSVQLSRTIAPTADSSTAASVNALAASYDFGMAKAYFSNYTQKAGATSAASSTTAMTVNGTALAEEKGTHVSVAIPIGAATIKAGMVNRGTNDSALDRSSIGVDYALSKRTTLIGEFARDKSAVTGANSVTNSFIGVQHTF